MTAVLMWDDAAAAVALVAAGAAALAMLRWAARRWPPCGWMDDSER